METRYQALLQRRADLTNDRNAAIAEYDALMAAAGDELTAEERARADEFEARIKAIDETLDTVLADIEREENLRELRREAALSREPREEPVRITNLRERVEDDPKRGFRDLADFALAVRQSVIPGGILDDRLRPVAAPSNFHRETGSPDGYMVPPEMRDAIWELVFPEESTDLIDLLELEPTSSNAVEMNVDESTPWGVSGIQANWRSEGTQMSPSRLDTDHRLNRVYELYAFVLATDELLQDAPRLSTRLTRGAARAIRWEASEAFMRGNGVGKPRGILESPALVTVAKESQQAADTIVAANVLRMYSQMLHGPNTFWLANSDTIPQLATMTIGHQPVWISPNGLIGAPNGGILLGRPVYLNEHCDTVGDVGDLVFVNPDGYQALRRTEGPEFASSIHLYFDYGIQAFRWTFRVGGQPILSAPVTPPSGGANKSHFVVLAERSA